MSAIQLGNLLFLLGGAIIVIIWGLVYWSLRRLSNYLINKRNLPTTMFQYKSIDGHVVKSKGELIVDTYLYLLNIKHEYEDIITVNGRLLKYDWFLPENETYMEYWGLKTKKYLKRKGQKIDLYNKGRLKLISIEDEMFSDISLSLKEALGIEHSGIPKHTLVKHCPNCGYKLDNRFVH